VVAVAIAIFVAFQIISGVPVGYSIVHVDIRILPQNSMQQWINVVTSCFRSVPQNSDSKLMNTCVSKVASKPNIVVVLCQLRTVCKCSSNIKVFGAGRIGCIHYLRCHAE